MKRILTLLGGGLLIIAGLALLVLPGPGLPLVAIGIMMLASEVPAVRRWLDKLIQRLPISEKKKEKIHSFMERKQKQAHS
jgi:UPF0716 family protein affecting phage T7 exclusion